MAVKYFNLTTRSISILHDKAFINNEWVNSKTMKTFKVINPATKKQIGMVPDMDYQDTQNAIDAAYNAFPEWSSLPAQHRALLFRQWHDLIQKYADEFARIITLESGKVLSEAKGEVLYGNSFLYWFAEEARRVHGEVLQSQGSDKETLVIKQPIGVVSVITPWNFPYAMIARKAGAALVVGCTCVIKPAEDTPLTALALCDLAKKAGFPKGVINVVTCDRPNAMEVGKELCEHTMVAGLSFTGSTKIGKHLYKQCSVGVKRIALELGGNAPFIVFKSADLDKAVEGAFLSKFRNCGQTCVSANKFLIQEEIFNKFVERLKLKMLTLKLGDGFQPDVNLGPLINKNQFSNVERIVKDAVSKGAKVKYGGKGAKDIGELFFMPTLLTNISRAMFCYTEEIFGPVAICMKFKSEDEAIKMGNDTKQGLVGYFYSNDISQVWRVARKMEVGMVGINAGSIATAEAPFGGIKESGFGREASSHGIEEFVYVKCICFGNLT